MYFGTLETQSNRADWEEVFQLTDEETGEMIDISGCRITMTVRRLEKGQEPDYVGYGSNAAAPVLTGSTDGGEILITDIGTFEWLFPATQLAAMCQGEYEVGMRISQEGRTVQLIVCTVPIIEGIDNQ